MTISVIIATYGADEWCVMAEERALRIHRRRRRPRHCITTPRRHPRHQPQQRSQVSATGDWLLFLDADDELAPGYVGAMRRALEQHQHDGQVLFTPAVQYIRKGRPGTPGFNDRGISLRDDNWLVIGTMIHRDLFNEVGGFDDYPHGFEDWALWSKCFRAGATIVKVPDAVYRAHVNPRSAHRQMWRDRKWQVATHLRVKAELDAWEAAR